jgi:predicted alpha-1,2-mannosidase
MRPVRSTALRPSPPALLASVLLLAGAAGLARAATPTAAVTDPAARVNVFVGTSGTAVGGPIDTFPGASLPFGMIQWSPDTPSAPAGGGYNYPDHAITGFSLTHLSGPGCSVAGDIRILPTSGAIRAPGSATLPLVHADEHGAPGWYAIRFARAGIGAELTVTRRTGLGRFSFPAGRAGNLLFNVSSNQAGVTAAHFRIDSPRQVSGSATGGAFCGAPDLYTIYFVARFNRPMSAYGAWRGSDVHPGARSMRGVGTGGWVSFDTARHRNVKVEVAISYVSRANALENLRAAPQRWQVRATRERATAIWNGMLRRIQISGGTRAAQSTFYTALYHTLLSPTLYSDVNGEYRGFDGRVHRLSAGHDEYANYSGWDIYRTEVPLLALLAPHRASDMMQSLLDEGRQGGWLPKWPLENGYTGVMGGDAADIILAGGWAFGARDFNVHEALREMVKGATDTHSPPGQGWYVERPGLKQYLRQGYLSDDMTTSSAPVPNGSSETLEYADDDFAIARLAGENGAMRLARRFLRRSMNWQNVFDTATGSISARDATGAFVATPINSNGQRGFQEGNAAQYTWMVPQDLHDLIDAMGGRAVARQRLNTFFTQLNAGQAAPYAWLGNEPSLGAPWVYLNAGAPWRTEEIVRTAIDTLYNDTPAGIPGNDDLGTMSAWYVWSAIGLYPQNPPVRGLLVGSPLFPRIVIASPGGLTVRINAPGAAANRPYVHALSVDGRSTEHTWLALPLRGTVRMHFTLGRTPDMLWGTAAQDAPPSYTAGTPHFPAATAASWHTLTRRTRVLPGHVALASFVLTDPRGAPVTTVHWHAIAPAGLRVHPAAGHLAIGPGETRTVRLTVSAHTGTLPGYYAIALRARAANGALLPATALIARTAPAGQVLPLLYLASFANNTVVPFDPATRASAPSIAVGENPDAVVSNATGTRIYVANQSSNTVSVIDGRTHVVLATVAVGSAPAALAIGGADHTLWVANGGSNTVEPIDTATRQAGVPIPVGSAPAGLALGPHGHTLYVSDQGSNTVTLVDTRTRKVRATFPAGASPTAVAVSPNGRTLYVTDTLAHQVLPIQTASGRAGKPLATGLSPRALALSPNGKLLYVANTAVDTLTVIHTVSGAEGAPITVGPGPIGVAFSRNGREAYAIDSQSGRCALIQTASGHVLASVPVAPFLMALSSPAVP